MFCRGLGGLHNFFYQFQSQIRECSVRREDFFCVLVTVVLQEWFSSSHEDFFSTSLKYHDKIVVTSASLFSYNLTTETSPFIIHFVVGRCSYLVCQIFILCGDIKILTAHSFDTYFYSVKP